MSAPELPEPFQDPSFDPNSTSAFQRRMGRWNPEDRAHLRQVMRSASSVSPYLIIWVVPGSMLLLPFMAWFIDMRRKGRHTPSLADHEGL